MLVKIFHTHNFLLIKFDFIEYLIKFCIFIVCFLFLRHATNAIQIHSMKILWTYLFLFKIVLFLISFFLETQKSKNDNEVSYNSLIINYFNFYFEFFISKKVFHKKLGLFHSNKLMQYWQQHYICFASANRKVKTFLP